MDEQAYAALFVDMAPYLLPDDTQARAVWDGSTWLIVPSDREIWYMQYEVQRDGSIIGARYTTQRAPLTKLFDTWPTDLCIEDFRPVQHG